jgi:hypothetical protein
MAELNWIDKNERLPTKADASPNGYIYAVTNHGLVLCAYLDHFETLVKDFTHWLPFAEIPVPKRWRTPTIHDLAKAGKPIPCRVRDTVAMDWKKSELCAIDIGVVETGSGRPFMDACGSWVYFCEIEE